METQSITCPRSFVLASYCTGDLKAADAEDIRKHLAECRRCRKILGDGEKIPSACTTRASTSSTECIKDNDFHQLV